MTKTRRSLLTIIGPGILVAATGVGAGDLATSAFAGSLLGLTVLWAAVLGAAVKWLLTEGIARWQLATGSTLLEGCVRHFGPIVQWFFLFYLFVWSFFVGLALMSACGVAMHAIFPLFDAQTDKIVYGVLHSAVAVVLVWLGGYGLFEKVMSVCIGVMFVTVVVTAIALQPDWAQVGRGLVVPRVPQLDGAGLQWTVALLGGIGGTVTLLCYGYWIREEGRQSPEDLAICRLDLAAGYAMTLIFGVALIIIGTQVEVEGKGARLLVQLTERLEQALGTAGPVARWAFLVGAWAAIFSSLLGVWQSVPYLFADFWMLRRSEPGEDVAVDTRAWPYRVYLLLLAIVPAAALFVNFRTAQKAYAIFGALFIPMLALALLVLNGRAGLVGERFRNRWPVTVVLVLTLAFFLVAVFLEARKQLG
ncbi:MAG: Nramp family divalent metal transporter [Planctomycetota bacterium]|jgi:Mn2+/Fe2+ NRAMP family transporter